MDEQAAIQEQEPQKKEYVWYACYGSNINRSRFLRYIDQCADKTPPEEERPFQFPYSIYFAGESKTWEGKGVAFLDPTKPGSAYGKIYKITKEQYRMVKRKEGKKYTKRISLGRIDGLRVYTFTCEVPYAVKTIPSMGYFDTILEGLKAQYTQVSEAQLGAYLVDAVLPVLAFQVLKAIRTSEHTVSNLTVSRVTGLSIIQVLEGKNQLLELQLIQQDRRSLRSGHRSDDEMAYFFTCVHQREFIDYMLRIKGAASAQQ